MQLPDGARRRREAVGTRLQQLRRARGLSQEALAHAAGLDRSFYVEVETAKHSITVDRMFDIADALGLSLGEVLRDL